VKHRNLFYFERKIHLDSRKTQIDYEMADLAARLETIGLTDEQVAEIEVFCTEVRDGLDYATFEYKQRHFELLNIQCVVTSENDERVRYFTCRHG
jgi:hypothetical protein